MCGIAGILPLRSRTPDEVGDVGLIERMTRELAHRGPDGEGIQQGEDFSFGHRRLSIIDLDGGAQPMATADERCWVTYNGEIYNYRELRSELEEAGHVFRTQSDTEVLLHGYREWGTGLCERLHGIFAFAIWDSHKKQALLVRDPLGIKPLYWTECDGLYFASEMKSLLKVPKLKRELNASSVASLLLFGWNTGESSFMKSVQQVTPGHYMIVKDGVVRDRKAYWRCDEVEREVMSTGAIEEELRERLKQIVKGQLIADVPLGLTLSGGLDSSSVVASFRATSEDPIHTFCVRYGLDSDEADAARLVADFHQTTHHERQLAFPQLNEKLAKIFWHLEDPGCNMTAPTTFFLSEFVRERVKVCLIGEGSDELFGGYTRYKIFAHQWRWLPLRPRVWTFLWPGHFAFLPWFLSSVSPMLSRRVVNDVLEDRFYSYFRRRGRSALNSALQFDVDHELPNHQLMRIDKLTMAHGLEARVPFLDHTFVKFVMQIPAWQKMPDHGEKMLLRRAMKDVLPQATVKRPKGASQYILGDWYRQGLMARIEELFETSVLVRDGVIKESVLRGCMAQAQSNSGRIRTRVAQMQLHYLFALEMWIRQFMDGEDLGQFG